MNSVLMICFFNEMWLFMTLWGFGDRLLEVLFDGGVGYILDSFEIVVYIKRLC